MPAPSRRSSISTPLQRVSNLDQVVTQWMSRVSSVWGSALISAHVQLRTGFGPIFRVKRHSSVATRGVGPADNTGKSVTRCCPGGSRLALAGASRRPMNPRVTIFAPLPCYQHEDVDQGPGLAPRATLPYAFDLGGKGPPDAAFTTPRTLKSLPGPILSTHDFDDLCVPAVMLPAAIQRSGAGDATTSGACFLPRPAAEHDPRTVVVCRQLRSDRIHISGQAAGIGATGMELHEIRYFLALSKTLNFTKAAEACHVSQPALTRAIRKMEDELGGLLFSRERNNTHMTELGRLIEPHLAEVLRRPGRRSAPPRASLSWKGESCARRDVHDCAGAIRELSGPLQGMERPPIRPDTGRNREGLGLRLGVRLCRTPPSVSKSSPAGSAVGATAPNTSWRWSRRPCCPA